MGLSLCIESEMTRKGDLLQPSVRTLSPSSLDSNFDAPCHTVVSRIGEGKGTSFLKELTLLFWGRLSHEAGRRDIFQRWICFVLPGAARGRLCLLRFFAQDSAAEFDR